MELGVVRTLGNRGILEYGTQFLERCLRVQLAALDVAQWDIDRLLADCQTQTDQLGAHRQEPRRLYVEGDRAAFPHDVDEAVQCLSRGDRLANGVGRLLPFREIV